MSDLVKVIINGKEIMAAKGSYIVDVARENGIYIPTLCNIPGVKPRGSCRICTVKVNGKLMTSCTTPVADRMEIESDLPELNDLRKAVVEMLFVDGNHFCPTCERSGNCDLQALGYRFRMTAPRFEFLFPYKQVDASNEKLIKDHNRCILCKRCIRAIKDDQGRSLFAFRKRGHTLEIALDPRLTAHLTDERAQEAMDICPVGALLRKGKGYDVPIGERTYDKETIGSQIEGKG